MADRDKACNRRLTSIAYKCKPKSESGLFGERNPMAKMTNADVALMCDLHDSYTEDIERIDSEIQRLKSERVEIKRRMSRAVIADLFGVSAGHCQQIISGLRRGRI